MSDAPPVRVRPHRPTTRRLNAGIVTPEAVRPRVRDRPASGRGACSRRARPRRSRSARCSSSSSGRRSPLGGDGQLRASAAAGSPSFVLPATFIVLWATRSSCETLWRGRTLGKAALGLRVVTVEGAPVRFRHAAIRATLGLVDFFAHVRRARCSRSLLLTRRSQRLGDLVAGTIVLRERTARPRHAGRRVPAAAGPRGVRARRSTWRASRRRLRRRSAAFLLRAAIARPRTPARRPRRRPSRSRSRPAAVHAVATTVSARSASSSAWPPSTSSAIGRPRGPRRRSPRSERRAPTRSTATARRPLAPQPPPAPSASRRRVATLAT